ncbi:phosphate uptake regulator, PhoU [Tistlia consotensis]|uniref:Phosphate-specific transport system accessory protein PhoU n=1 Tax=Tistlia consotensis USBA 355 TaxID=560819 RepID=A0A1Y6B7Z1_9PROT|nr:phosphate signaling complex protein PhoU [Tistlia consotensis]SME94860.1 phosphate uptake regulator, PhoU [Tistlia consotensis USBA 355]SNR29597.1 phosphate uptake regulator, PhoU [Tistlia consotensis]
MTDPRGEHIVRAFDAELQELEHTIVRMGGMAEAALETAVEALARRNSTVAAEVVQGDREIDLLEQQISERSIHTLALRQPMASDLREVVAALRISGELERIGDYAANIAKRAMALNQLPPMRPAHSIPRMARLVQSNIKRVLDAYVARDAELAAHVWESDEEIDETYTSLFRETLTYMMEDPRNITPCTHLLFIAKNIERIGDHATNVAELVYYLVKGQRLEGGRPKGDTSSYTVVEPPEGGRGRAATEESPKP